MADITMSEEALKKLVSDSATQAATAATTNFNASMLERDKISLAETERKSGFITLSANYPEMSAMINEEMAKPEATANADFFVKVAAADKARLVALEEQENNSENNAGNDGKPDGETETATAVQNDVSALAGQLGVDLTEGAN